MATLLGKNMSSSASMAGEKEDSAMVDPNNMVDIKYNDLLEEQRQAPEAQLKKIEAESKRRLVSCFGRTRHGLVEKEKFIPLNLPSTNSKQCKQPAF